jgi:hypothetical protein
MVAPGTEDRPPMLYAIICYNNESIIGSWSKEQDDRVMADHQVVLNDLAQKRRLGPVARLLPTTSAVTVRAGHEKLVLDGPFAETKEQLLGFYVVECASLEEAINVAHRVSVEGGAIEVRPIKFFEPGIGLPGAPVT